MDSAANQPLTYLESLLAETRDELTRVDTKAAVLLGAAGVLATLAIGAFPGGRWSPSALDNRVEWLWWLTSALGGGGIFLLGRALLPIVHHDLDRSRVAFFGHIVQFHDRQELAAALASEKLSHYDRAIDQLWVVSQIVARKYRDIRLAMIALAAFLLGSAVAVLIGHALQPR